MNILKRLLPLVFLAVTTSIFASETAGQGSSLYYPVAPRIVHGAAFGSCEIGELLIAFSGTVVVKKGYWGSGLHEECFWESAPKVKFGGPLGETAFGTFSMLSYNIAPHRDGIFGNYLKSYEVSGSYVLTATITVTNTSDAPIFTWPDVIASMKQGYFLVSFGDHKGVLKKFEFRNFKTLVTAIPDFMMTP